jgi:phosphoglycolate phosphatase-like HAD superfamily hydrolase
MLGRILLAALLVAGLSGWDGISAWAQSDPLPSWNDGAVKKAIIGFVAQVTTQGSPGFVPVEQRIATFDNDGTLWAEQPMYFQLAFAFDRVAALAPQHSEWKTTQPFKAVLEHDMVAFGASGEKGMLEILAATHSGMTTDEFSKIVTEWIATARHPRFKRPYNELIYQPMVELLGYLRANGFKTFIVSGGGVEFMRPWVEKAYGIPPEQVVGSSGVTKLQIGANGEPELMKESKVEFVNDGPGKPVGINRFIGRRPIFAFGNSDGDLQMLQWTAVGSGARFMGLVHHTDAEREYAYDRKSDSGRLDKALDEANAKGWSVVDMRADWRTIFPEPH